MMPRRFVKTFKPRFVPKVRDGTKTQTFRPTPKRVCDMPKLGDIIDCRYWSGPAYRSPQKKIREGTICGVFEASLIHDELTIAGRKVATEGEREAFAQADGFHDYADMLAWFTDEHGPKFSGILIVWKNTP